MTKLFKNKIKKLTKIKENYFNTHARTIGDLVNIRIKDLLIQGKLLC